MGPQAEVVRRLVTREPVGNWHVGMAGELKRAETFFDEVVRGFIFGDIQQGVDGRANYLAALGLVCYTEFMGGLARGKLEKGNSARNFRCFFGRMGKQYEDFGL